MESYKHRFAKDVLAGWMPHLIGAERGPQFVDDYSTFLEYPICLDAAGKVRGLHGWGGVPPKYEELLARELLPIVIFDVAILFRFNRDNPSSGLLRSAIEVVHKHPISTVKAQYLDRVAHALWDEWTSDLTVDVVDADWVLSRCSPPNKLHCVERIEWRRGVRV